jgi:hypothetical protein
MEGGSCQKRDIESDCIPTIFNGYTDPLKWRDRKVQNNDGVPNALKTTGKSYTEEGDSKNRVEGEESVIEEAPYKKLSSQQNFKNVNSLGSKYRIIIVGDSSGRSCSNEVKQEVGRGFEVLGTVKLGASTEVIINTVSKDIGDLTCKDVVIVWT